VTATQLRLHGLHENDTGGGRGIITIDSIVHTWGTDPTLATGGLAASTAYFVYAFVSAGVVTLEASTTSPSPPAEYEQYSIKTGDRTRVLVGTTKTDGSVQFSRDDTKTIRHAFDDPYGVLSAFAEVDWDEGGATPPPVVESGDCLTFSMANSVTRSVISNIQAPRSIDLTFNPKLVVRFVPLAPIGTAGNVLLRLTCRYIVVGGLTTAAADEVISMTPAVTATVDRLHELTFTLNSSLMSLADQFSFRLERLGADAADTYNAAVGIVEVSQIQFRNV